MAKLNEWMNLVNDWVWGPFLLFLLLGTELFLTIRTKGIQRHLWKGMRLLVTKKRKLPGEISLFGSFAMELAISMGASSFVGVATAVAFGGAGAVFWLCVTGVLGMAMRYGEALLAVQYRTQTEEGTVLGGMMCVLNFGIGKKWLGIFFAVLFGIGVFLIGNLAQSHVIVGVVSLQFSIKPYITGILLLLFTGAVISGGVSSICRTCKKVAPSMVVVYIIGCGVLLVQNRGYLLVAIQEIFARAFTASAVGGSFAGIGAITAVRYGLTQGFFADGIGVGGNAVIAGAAQSENPVQAALVSMTVSFWNTVVVCGMTGLVIVSSICKQSIAVEELSGGSLIAMTYNSISGIGPVLLTISLLIFSWTALLGWCYCGERAWEYLLGQGSRIPFRIVWIVILFFGCVTTADILWKIGDFLRGCLVLFHIGILLVCNGVIARETKNHLKSKVLETKMPQKND